MTAINVMLTREYAVMVTDTLAKSALGSDFHTAKVLPIPHMRIAVGTRGRMDALGKAVAAICAAAGDYDTTRAFMATGGYRDLGFGDVEIVVAGWSAKGPAAFIISSTNTNGRVMDIEHVLVTPTVPAADFEAFAANPVARMPALLKRQAASGGVGGVMAVTQVGKHAIESYAAGAI